MIDFFKGTILAIDNQAVRIAVGDIGFSVSVAHGHQFSVGTDTKLYIYLHWNSDQGPSLFGFSSTVERTLFTMIIGCVGIGPRIALAILGQMSVAELIAALSSDDVQALSSVNGIGPRKAEQMIVQLRPKVAALMESGESIDMPSDRTHWKDVSDTLSSLNYSRTEVARTMKYLTEHQSDQAASFDLLLRQALAFLSKRI